jgi:hypothetical protein
VRAWWTILALAACGDGIAPVALDAVVDDQRGLVTFTYLAGDGDQIQDRLVFFQNSDSGLVLSTRTDGTGRADAFMRSGGYVTAIEERGNSKFMFTYAGVEPGDNLVLDRRQPSAGSLELEVSIPGAPEAVGYQLYTSCSFGGSVDLTGADKAPVFVTLFGCAPTVSMLVIALLPGGGRSYLYRGNVLLQTFDRVTFQGPYRAFDTARVQVSAAPPATSSAFVSQEVSGIHLPANFENVALVAGGGVATFQVPAPAGAVITTRVDLDSGFTIGTQRAALWSPASASTTIDLAGGTRQYTARPSFDKTFNGIRWEEAAAGQTANIVLAGVAWARFTTSYNYQWLLIGPRGADPVRSFPVLPEPDLRPTDDETPNPFTLVNFALDAGYDALREDFLGTWNAGDPWRAEGDTGKVLYQELGFGPNF